MGYNPITEVVHLAEKKSSGAMGKMVVDVVVVVAPASEPELEGWMEYMCRK